MLILLPYLRAGLCHYTFSISFRASSPSVLSNIMKFVLFLRALLFFVFATSLAAGFPTTKFVPIAEERAYLTRGGGWIREKAPDHVNRFFLSFS